MTFLHDSLVKKFFIYCYNKLLQVNFNRIITKHSATIDELRKIIKYLVKDS
jgi:hypothetical protein